MGDRVAVMRDGRAAAGRPAADRCTTTRTNLFVAAFIGSPAMNLYEASLTEGARTLRLGSQEIDLPDSVRAAHPGLAAYASRQVVVGLRPEHLPAAVNGTAGPTLAGNVDLIESLGSELVVHFTTDARRVRAEGALDPTEQAGEGVARLDPGSPVRVGERITFAIRAEGMQFFDADSGDAIWGD